MASNILECPVCYEETNVPKILQCHHWICSVCAESLVAKSQDMSITCPQCREITPVPDGKVGQLRDDFRTLQLQEAIRNNQRNHGDETGSPQPIKCVNDDEPASFKCRECVLYMCDKCKKEHKDRKLFTEHELIPLDNIVCVCINHNHDYIYFCGKCPRLLCKVCALRECIDHENDIQLLSKVTPNAKEELNVLQLDLEKKLHLIKNDIRPNLQHIDKEIANVLKIKDDVKAHGKAVLSKVELNITSLVDKAEARHQSLLAIRTQLSQYNEGQLQDMMQTVQDAHSKRPEEILITNNLIRSALPPPMEEYKPESKKTYTFKVNHSKVNLGIIQEAVIKDKTQSETTIRFTVNGISKFKDKAISYVVTFKNFSWNVMVMCSTTVDVLVSSGTTTTGTTTTTFTKKGIETKAFGIFLQCNVDSESETQWSCQAHAEFRLLTHHPEKAHLVRQAEHLFCNKQHDWGYKEFISWTDLLDPERGYVKKDAVTWEVHVR